jgi:tRNA U34 5-methylaminomethyl-2-thiouridine-forming methyltransferase MnmC
MSTINIAPQEPITLQVLLLKGEGLYEGCKKLTFVAFPKYWNKEVKKFEELKTTEPEFHYFAKLILKGWEGPLLITEFAELALEGLVPSELSREKLKNWLSWFATEVKYG